MKRKALEVQRIVINTIRKNPDITMSQLERKVGTNPRSLKEHCEALAYLGIIKITKTEKTRKVRIV